MFNSFSIITKGEISISIKNKAILVTGGAGFIGSHLVDELVSNDPEKIIVVDNFFLGKESNLKESIENFEEIYVYKKDAVDPEAMQEILEKESVDVVFDLAVIPLPTSLVQPKFTAEINYNIVLNMCELLWKGFYDTLIHFSTSEVYGTAQYVPIDEKHPINPMTPYAASKASGDHLVLSYHRTFGVDAAIIRPFNIYGPRQNFGDYAGIIPVSIRKMTNGESPVIYGSGEQTRDFNYVTDVASAAVKIYETAATRCRVVNIASGEEVSVNRLIETLCDLIGFKGEIIHKEPRSGDVMRHLGGAALARSLLNYEPKIKMDEGLNLTIAWYNIILTKEESYK